MSMSKMTINSNSNSICRDKQTLHCCSRSASSCYLLIITRFIQFFLLFIVFSDNHKCFAFQFSISSSNNHNNHIIKKSSFFTEYQHHHSIINSNNINCNHGNNNMNVISNEQRNILKQFSFIKSETRKRSSILLSSRSDSINYDDEQQQIFNNNKNDDTDTSEQQSSSYLATCIPGLANVLAEELIQLKCVDVTIESTSAVTFQVYDIKTILNVLLYTRTAHKILELLCSTKKTQSNDNDDDPYNDDNNMDSDTSSVIHNRDDLYQFVKNSINVKELLGDGNGGLLTLAVSVIYNNARLIPNDINHSHYTSLLIKNALVDTVRELRNDDNRPSIHLLNPDVPIHAIIYGIIPSSTSTQQFNNYNNNNNNNYNNNNNRRQPWKGESSYQGKYQNQQQWQPNQQQQQRQQQTDSNSEGGAGAHVSIYRQIHIGSLHRRGYRNDDSHLPIHKAAMKESLAAGLLLQSGWDKLCYDHFHQNNNNNNNNNDSLEQSSDYDEQQQKQKEQLLVLMDPMVGSGTFLIEGIMIAINMPPGLMRIKCNVLGSRNPPILRWKHNTNINDIWNEVLYNATIQVKESIHQFTSNKNGKIMILGNDIYENAIHLAEQSLQISGLRELVDELSVNDCKDWKPNVITSSLLSTPPIIHHEDNDDNINDRTTATITTESSSSESTTIIKTLVVCNPPWGIRLDGQNLKQVYNNNNNDNVNINKDDDNNNETNDYVVNAWESLRIFLREYCPSLSTTAWILCGNKSLTKHLGLQRSISIPIKTGEQDLRYLQYIIRNHNTQNRIKIEEKDEDNTVASKYESSSTSTDSWRSSNDDDSIKSSSFDYREKVNGMTSRNNNNVGRSPAAERTGDNNVRNMRFSSNTRNNDYDGRNMRSSSSTRNNDYDNNIRNMGRSNTRRDDSPPPSYLNGLVSNKNRFDDESTKSSRRQTTIKKKKKRLKGDFVKKNEWLSDD